MRTGRCGIIISTHILTRRMTTLVALFHHNVFISTHILTRRMTTKKAHKLSKKENFNSHPHKEDDGVGGEKEGAQKISTHILTRRMTYICAPVRYAPIYFNSHPHKEDDVQKHKIFPTKEDFNSHPHKEDDCWDLRSAT